MGSLVQAVSSLCRALSHRYHRNQPSPLRSLTATTLLSWSQVSISAALLHHRFSCQAVTALCRAQPRRQFTPRRAPSLRPSSDREARELQW
ncbi:hypothetical protein F2Q68_00039393 [Brassica cretica]|uniref:Uncharacterized protein n=2 Tax=Brassica cretica TaxID=69181 RepID=A0ABQ7AMP7_BRACR|nr:hypothetical protein F2Q68_00039393 [Brassica cretica]KAF3498997.1 hypothetical protein DY000_02052978 [Brassica cretica]